MKDSVGTICSGGVDIMCENIWSAEFCRWDCEVLETHEDVMQFDKDKMWTIKSHDASTDNWDGCHYYCYSKCSVCNRKKLNPENWR